MPKFDVSKRDLERLVGKEFSVEEWEDSSSMPNVN